jgi:hypothetical protein
VNQGQRVAIVAALAVCAVGLGFVTLPVAYLVLWTTVNLLMIVILEVRDGWPYLLAIAVIVTIVQLRWWWKNSN